MTCFSFGRKYMEVVKEYSPRGTIHPRYSVTFTQRCVSDFKRKYDFDHFHSGLDDISYYLNLGYLISSHYNDILHSKFLNKHNRIVHLTVYDADDCVVHSGFIDCRSHKHSQCSAVYPFIPKGQYW